MLFFILIDTQIAAAAKRRIEGNWACHFQLFYSYIFLLFVGLPRCIESRPRERGASKKWVNWTTIAHHCSFSIERECKSCDKTGPSENTSSLLVPVRDLFFCGYSELVACVTPANVLVIRCQTCPAIIGNRKIGFIKKLLRIPSNVQYFANKRTLACSPHYHTHHRMRQLTRCNV